MGIHLLILLVQEQLKMFLKVGNAKLRCYKNKACILYIFDVIYGSVFDCFFFSHIASYL